MGDIIKILEELLPCIIACLPPLAASLLEHLCLRNIRILNKKGKVR